MWSEVAISHESVETPDSSAAASLLRCKRSGLGRNRELIEPGVTGIGIENAEVGLE